MEITKEMLQKKVDEMVQRNDGFKQGFIEACSWAFSTLEQKEEVKEPTIVK